MKHNVRNAVTVAVILAIIGAAVGGYFYWQKLHWPNHFDRVSEGIFRGAQPNDRQFDSIQRTYHLRTDICIRESQPNTTWEANERAWCQRNGVEFHQISIADDRGKVPTDEQVIQFLRYARPESRPVYFHCELGRSRTGKMAAAYRIIMEDGSPPAVYEEMQKYGFIAERQDPQQVVRKWLDYLVQNKAALKQAASAP